MFYKHGCGCIVLKESEDSPEEILVKDCNSGYLFLRQKTEDYPAYNKRVAKIISDLEKIEIFNNIQALINDGLTLRKIKKLLKE
jgi:hypothetical protein